MSGNWWDAHPVASGPQPVIGLTPVQQAQQQAQVANTGANTSRTTAEIPAAVAAGQVATATVAPSIKKIAAEATQADQGTRFNGLSPAAYADALSLFNGSNYIAQAQQELARKFAAGPGKTQGLTGIKDFLPLPSNQDFDNTANRLRAWAKQGTGTTGGENNTAAEMKMNLGPYIPSSWNYDQTSQGQIDAIGNLGRKASKEAVQRLGGVPDQNGNITPVPQGYTWGQNPALDRSISRMIGNVPPAARQGWMLRELAKYKAMTAKASAPRNKTIDFSQLQD